jgi:hypothetical protein
MVTKHEVQPGDPIGFDFATGKAIRATPEDVAPAPPALAAPAAQLPPAVPVGLLGERAFAKSAPATPIASVSAARGPLWKTNPLSADEVREYVRRQPRESAYSCSPRRGC